MVRFIPYEKLPKKKQHELDRQKRGSWNGVNPITRKPEDSKVYNRKKAQSWKKDNSDALLFYNEHEKSGALAGFLPFWPTYPRHLQLPHSSLPYPCMRA
jgi:hypothetical protein